VIHTEQPQSTTNSPRPEKVSDFLANWTVNPTGMTFGLWLGVELGDNSDQLFINPLNLFMRTLSASIQYLDESGNPIPGQPPTPIGGVPAAILGLPVPDASIEWTVDMKGYGQANLLFGSLGRNLDVEASPPGALATGLFRYYCQPFSFLLALGLEPGRLTPPFRRSSNNLFSPCSKRLAR
jgi:hypothetical protein